MWSIMTPPILVTAVRFLPILRDVVLRYYYSSPGLNRRPTASFSLVSLPFLRIFFPSDFPQPLVYSTTGAVSIPIFSSFARSIAVSPPFARSVAPLLDRSAINVSASSICLLASLDFSCVSFAHSGCCCSASEFQSPVVRDAGMIPVAVLRVMSG